MKKIFSAFVVISLLLFYSEIYSQIIYPTHCDTLYWSHSAGATWYRLQILDSNVVLLDSNHIVDTFFVLHNMPSNQQLYMRVKAYSTIDSGSWIGTYIVIPGLPQPPIFLGYYCPTHTIYWLKVIIANYYHLRIFSDHDTNNLVFESDHILDTFKVLASILLESSTYYLKLQSSNYCGYGLGSPLYSFTTCPQGIKQISTDIPNKFELFQNYPNPFNPTTKIKFDIPSFNPPFMKGGQSLPAEASAQAGGLTTLKIYDILGREVATLVNEKLNPGTYEVEWYGTNYPSGVYFYKIITDNYISTKKMALLK